MWVFFFFFNEVFIQCFSQLLFIIFIQSWLQIGQREPLPSDSNVHWDMPISLKVLFCFQTKKIFFPHFLTYLTVDSAFSPWNMLHKGWVTLVPLSQLAKMWLSASKPSDAPSCPGPMPHACTPSCDHSWVSRHQLEGSQSESDKTRKVVGGRTMHGPRL